MINSEFLRNLNACDEGYASFAAKFPSNASYKQIFTVMEKEHCIWLIVALARNNECPSEILELIPIQYSKETRRNFYRYLVANWASIKPALLSIKLDSL